MSKVTNHSFPSTIYTGSKSSLKSASSEKYFCFDTNGTIFNTRTFHIASFVVGLILVGIGLAGIVGTALLFPYTSSLSDLLGGLASFPFAIGGVMAAESIYYFAQKHCCKPKKFSW